VVWVFDRNKFGIVGDFILGMLGALIEGKVGRFIDGIVGFLIDGKFQLLLPASFKGVVFALVIGGGFGLDLIKSSELKDFVEGKGGSFFFGGADSTRFGDTSTVGPLFGGKELTFELGGFGRPGDFLAGLGFGIVFKNELTEFPLGRLGGLFIEGALGSFANEASSDVLVKGTFFDLFQRFESVSSSSSSIFFVKLGAVALR